MSTDFEDAQYWMDALNANNPPADVLANFLNWYHETLRWREAIERNNPGANER